MFLLWRQAGNVSMQEKVRTIIILDEARSYGGTIEVTSLFTRHFDRERYKFIFITSVGKEVLNGKFDSNTQIYSFRKRIGYTGFMKFRTQLAALPIIIQKMLLYMLVILSFVINSGYYLNILMLFLKTKADVIHINNGYFGFVLTKLFKVPLVAHVHGPGVFETRKDKHLLKRASKYIAISNYVKQNMLDSGLEGNKITVVYNAAEVIPVKQTALESIRHNYNISADDKVIGFFGRVVAWKGQKEFLISVSKLVKKLPNIKILIVGDSADDIDTSYIESLKDLTNKPDLEGKIIFAGYQSNVHPFYEISDLVVHGSISPEPFGLVIVEAMTHKKPVIASNLGTPPEIITDGVEGFIVDPFNAQLLSEKMYEILTNTELAKSMGDAGYEKVISEFSPNKQADSIKDVYESVI